MIPQQMWTVHQIITITTVSADLKKDIIKCSDQSKRRENGRKSC